ncbi:hypothetical protein [Sphingomonas sp. PB4P5]|uniref:hypothetical protein n=1 Tax=Parasphingomonas puruogangriensis TaxID=3096155 RepID=UPI002FC5EB65
MMAGSNASPPPSPAQQKGKTVSEGIQSMTPRLRAAIEKARSHVMSPAEKFEQRVSFVYGMMGANSTRTKDDIRRSLIDASGYPLPDRSVILQAVERNWNAGPDALTDAILFALNEPIGQVGEG